MSREQIKIKHKATGQPFASAVIDEGVQLFEGAWYFDREHVDMSHLTITDRTYTCPYKGVCYWIDLASPELSVQDVGWTYFEVKPGYEFIQDKIGFYAGARGGTVEEAVEL